MLNIKNKDKLVGEQFVVPTPTTIWTVIGVHTYGPDGEYQIHLRASGNIDDRVFILSEESSFFLSGNANYKIKDAFEPFHSIWVRRESVGSVKSMLRTLKRIISHANN
jgi:hypothetical protein